MIKHLIVMCLFLGSVNSVAYSAECVGGNCRLRNRTVAKQQVATSPIVTRKNSNYTRSYRTYRTRTVVR